MRQFNVHFSLYKITLLNVTPSFIPEILGNGCSQSNFTPCCHVFFPCITGFTLLVAGSSGGSTSRITSAHLPLFHVTFFTRQFTLMVEMCVCGGVEFRGCLGSREQRLWEGFKNLETKVELMCKKNDQRLPHIVDENYLRRSNRI